MSVKRVMVIAGSDSSGGAYVLSIYPSAAMELTDLTTYRGLEADQRVLAAHGCYAMTATTGLTAQNTLGVQDVFIVPPLFVRKQIDAALDDIGADAVKLGTYSRLCLCMPVTVTDLFPLQGCLLLQGPSKWFRKLWWLIACHTWWWTRYLASP